MKLTLVCSSLGCGGTERVVSTLANHWSAEGISVTVVTLSQRTEDFFQLDGKVRRETLPVAGILPRLLPRGILNVWRFRKLRTAIAAATPDCVLSFGDTTNVLTLLATRGLRSRVIVSERSDPRHHPIKAGWGLLRKRFYPRADALVAQTRPVRDWLAGFVDPSKLHVIPNPLVIPPDRPFSELPSERPRLVALGRFTREKGFDLLLRAYAACPKDPAGWPLVVAGDGPDRDALAALAKELGIQERVRFPGRVRDPFGLLRSSDLFVLPSRYEGFPNALMEAMSCGLAVLAFDGSSGPRELIQNGYNGLLVPSENVRELAGAMSGLMKDEARRRSLGANAGASVQRFRLEEVSRQWLSLVEAQLARGRTLVPTP